MVESKLNSIMLAVKHSYLQRGELTLVFKVDVDTYFNEQFGQGGAK
jgi:hypothetical protein